MPIEEMKKNVILLGDGAVGKTSLIRRYVLDQFDDRYVTTIGSKVSKKEVELSIGTSHVRMVILIWDIIGQKEYELTQTLSMRNIDGAILVSDITRRETLDSLKEYWIPKIKQVRGNIPLVFLANKSDLIDERTFDVEDMKDLAAEMQDGNRNRDSAHCFLTSAKSGENIEASFRTLAGALIGNANKSTPDVQLQDMLKSTEARSLANVVDFVIADFAQQYGGIEVATPIVRHQMALAGLNPSDPTLEAVTKFIENMAAVERTFKPVDDVQVNKQQRLQKLKEF